MSDLGVSNQTFLHLQKRWLDRKPPRFACSELISDVSLKIKSLIHFDFSDLLKNRIPLPVNDCRFMYGCAFESQLKPGTCFIRYQILDENGKSLPNPQFKCVQGRVIVTKNPWYKTLFNLI